MEHFTGGWEAEYSRRGLLWGGATQNLPPVPAGSRVLEIGCGNGKTLASMIQRGWDVTAIDFSRRAIAMSRERCAGASSFEFMVADTMHLPFKKTSFNAVFAIHIFGHLPEPERKLLPHDLEKILKPGGILFFSDFSTGDFRLGSGFEMETATFRRGTGIITHYFSRQEVLDLFSNLTPVWIRIHEWPLRILGKNLVHSEIQAVFTR
jgi:ubiquinone/menaquinone biosynthesis C-methylase UbiE